MPRPLRRRPHGGAGRRRWNTARAARIPGLSSSLPAVRGATRFPMKTERSSSRNLGSPDSSLASTLPPRRTIRRALRATGRRYRMVRSVRRDLKTSLIFRSWGACSRAFRHKTLRLPALRYTRVREEPTTPRNWITTPGAPTFLLASRVLSFEARPSGRRSRKSWMRLAATPDCSTTFR